MYVGTVASELAKEIQNSGGIITEEDLHNYQPVIRKPLIAKDIYGFTLVGVPPPSSGGATVIGLARIMAGFNDPFATFSDTLSKHRYIEASKNVFAIRMSLSDPAFFTNVTLAAVNDLVYTDYVDTLRRQHISDSNIQPLSSYGGKKWAQLNDGDGNLEKKDMHEGDRKLRRQNQHKKAATDRNLLLFNYLEDHGTSHFSIIDKDRNAVSMTTTVNTIFGSAVVSPSTGILFNDQMDDFSTPGRPNFYGLHPSESNYISSGKRPLSSMSPTLIFHHGRDDSFSKEDKDNSTKLGRLMMALGGSGGPKIITAVFQVFFNYAVLGMPLFESVSHPRVHNQLLYHSQDVSGLEDSAALKGQKIEVSTRTKEALTQRGQKLLPIDYTGTVQAAIVDFETDLLTAVSDIRKGGSPAGY
jgi:gamma-glutamyltranspeptidase